MSPFVIRKIKNQNLYSVKNRDTGAVHSYGTTLDKAKKQIRLMYFTDRMKTSKKE
jgi:hypothetical protein